MNLIKKIAAIMFAFMMVVSMSCNVKAEDTEGVYGQNDGSITITGALQGQTYTIYEMLKLESFSGTNYSYKIAEGWENFFKEGAEGAAYMQKDENGYMSFRTGKDGDADRREFAQKALAYAREGHGINTQNNSPLEGKDTVEFTGLNLGYYLVGSTTGSLCGLNTTNKHVDIKEKNDVPSVDKTITDGGVLATDHKSNSVNIGDIVTFQTMIDVKKGAQGYELHDTLSTGLKLISKINDHTNSPIMAVASGTDESGKAFNNNLTKDSHYTITYDDHSFTVTILDSYLKTHETVDYHIAISYKAILTNAAVVGGAGNANETYLKYGVSSESTPSTTTTYTFEIPVFKYTETNTALAGAKFKLYTDAQCKDENVVKVIANGKDYVVGETDSNNNVMTSGTEIFNINGLKAGIYYLKEIEAPKGYNKLANPIKITISQNDAKNQVVTVGDDTNPVDEVGVENKTGKVLPSTGGVGTTMIYLIGGVLVLGSGVVLATKRRVKNK